MTTLGPYIRQLRRKRKLPLRTVAEAVGKSASYISDIELGRRLTDRANPELLIALADFFKVPVTTLMQIGGYEVNEHAEQYKDFVKVVRNKTKATFMVDKLEVMKELITQIEAATLSLPGVRGTVKSLMITLTELENVIVKRSGKSA